jgi:hypothetical protein
MILFHLFNSKKSLANQTDDEDEDENDSDDDKSQLNKIISEIDTSDFPKGYKIVLKSIASLRIDAIIAAGLSLSRK